MGCNCEMEQSYPNTCKALKKALEDERKATDEYRMMALMDGIDVKQAEVLRGISKQEGEHFFKINKIRMEVECL